MIVSVTLNLALDVTHTVSEMLPDHAHRVRDVAARAGGKEVNVARVLRALGHDVVVAGFVGGITGQSVRCDLRRAGLAEALEPIAGETRRTFTVVDASTGGATMFTEPGPTVADAKWTRFLDRLRLLLARAAALVLSGSLPPGLSRDAYARCARTAMEAGVPTVLDADGKRCGMGWRGGPQLPSRTSRIRSPW